MTKKKTEKKGLKKQRTLTPQGKAAQEALQITWLLKGSLKNVQLSYLRVGKLLSQVREKKMYEALGHADIEDYAEKRLQLGRASLYRYMQVHDWVSKNHPEWLQPKPKGYIPDLYDVASLMTVEKGLQQKNVSPQKRTKLQALKDKALAGGLTEGEVRELGKTSAAKVYTLKSIATNLKALRKKVAGVSGMPSEVIAHLDAALAILNNENAIAHVQLMPSAERMLA